MSILEDIEFEENMKELKAKTRKRSEGIVSKLQQLNHEARIRYGYIPASGGAAAEDSVSKESSTRPAGSADKTKSSSTK